MKVRKNGEDILALVVRAAERLCVLGTVIAGIWIGLGILSVGSDPDMRRGCTAARGVLRDTGLEAAAQYTNGVTALHCDTYFRDGDETVIFQFQWSERDAVWRAVCDAPGWQTAAIPAEAYTALARKEFWTPNEVVAPAADIVFDAWFYRDDYFVQYGERAGSGAYDGLPEVFGLNGTPDTLNATFAFYDRESGAFFYHAYDT